MARGNSVRSRPFKAVADMRDCIHLLVSTTIYEEYSLQITMPSLNIPKLVHCLAIGVFCLCVTAVPWVKEGHISFADAFLLALIAVNLGTLNAVVLLPRLSQAENQQVLIVNLAVILAVLIAALRHALLPALVLVNLGVLNLVAFFLPRVRQTQQVPDHVDGPGTLVIYGGFPRCPQEDLFITIVLGLAGKIQLLIQATTFCPAALALLDTEHSAVEPAQLVPGIGDGEASVLQVIFVFLAVLGIDSAMILSNVVLCVLLMLASAYSNVRRQSWCLSVDSHDEDPDATLVDDTQELAEDMRPVRADTLRSPSPPPSPAQLSSLRADAPDFILSFANPDHTLDPAPLTIEEDAAPSDLQAIAPSTRFEPSAPAFIPFRCPTSAPRAPNVRLASTENVKKKEWQPTRALSFPWAPDSHHRPARARPSISRDSPARANRRACFYRRRKEEGMGAHSCALLSMGARRLPDSYQCPSRPDS
ncbi:hypothetical protein C8R47DRAFT_1104387 [Mycena vitilis]|nr:hypothetical protein C8R47DRAFT_1104387 [Mycena vitilis]